MLAISFHFFFFFHLAIPVSSFFMSSFLSSKIATGWGHFQTKAVGGVTVRTSCWCETSQMLMFIVLSCTCSKTSRSVTWPDGRDDNHRLLQWHFLQKAETLQNSIIDFFWWCILCEVNKHWCLSLIIVRSEIIFSIVSDVIHPFRDPLPFSFHCLIFHLCFNNPSH